MSFLSQQTFLQWSKNSLVTSLCKINKPFFNTGRSVYILYSTNTHLPTESNTIRKKKEKRERNIKEILFYKFNDTFKSSIHLRVDLHRAMIKNITTKILEEVLPKILKSTKKMPRDQRRPIKTNVFLRRSSSEITPTSCLHETKSRTGCTCAVHQNQKNCTIYYDEQDKCYILKLIFFAIQYDNTDLLLQICAQSQMNLNVLNVDGVSALHFAVIVGSHKCMEILKQHGACLNFKDIRGQIPMHYYQAESCTTNTTSINSITSQC